MTGTDLPRDAGARDYLVLRAALTRFGKTPAELNGGDLETVNRQARREFELESLVLQSPEAREVCLEPSAIDKAVATIAERYPDADEFEEDLARNGLDMAGLRRALERELRVEAVLDRVASRGVEVGDLEARIYYYMHPEKFTAPEVRVARHILVTVNDAYPENTRAAALARIEQIAERVRRKPQRFAEQAGKHSECPTAMQGGALGRVPRGQLYPELESVLFALREGGVSGVVESPLGFHVLYCEAVQSKRRVPLEEALPQIKEKLGERQRRMCQRAWLKRLSGGANEEDAA